MEVVAGDGEAVGCSSGAVVRLAVGLGVARGPIGDGGSVENGRWEALYRDEGFILRKICHTTSTRTVCKIQEASHTKPV